MVRLELGIEKAKSGKVTFELKWTQGEAAPATPAAPSAPVVAASKPAETAPASEPASVASKVFESTFSEHENLS